MASLMRLLVLGVVSSAIVNGESNNMNPIRKVVTMLQRMQKKVTEEGKREEDLYEKFMCYCKTGKADLDAAIKGANVKVPQVQSDIEAAQGSLAQAKADLKSAQDDRAEAKQAIAEATGLREKEAATFAQEHSDFNSNIAALKKAITALEKGMAGSFLQTSEAQVLRNLMTKNIDISNVDREDLVSFLSQGNDYAPQSGEITGILKQMLDTMIKDNEDTVAKEKESIKTYDELVAAKKKEIESCTSTVEAKTAQIGELGISLVQMKEDLSDTEAALVQDQKYAAELDKSCATKTGEWEERKKTRADELVALADTIKVLNDDDALDLFKGTLGKDSFLQIQSSSSAQRIQALEVVRAAKDKANARDRAAFDFLALALSGKSAGKGTFDKVLKMVDDMVALLKKEQVDDDNKKEFCGVELDNTDDKRKTLERDIADQKNSIATTEDRISTLKEEIKALTAGIKELDKSVAEATEQRKEENAEYKDLMASNGAAKQILNFAKNRLNKFYNPKLYKPPAKVELTAQERIAQDVGGVQAATPPPSGIAGTGISVGFLQLSSRRDAPAPPPETWGAYGKKSQENTGVVAMIDLLISDLDKEMTEAETSEKDSQSDYEAMMKDSADKRATDTKSLTEKESAKADSEAALQRHNEAKKASTGELMTTMEYMSSVHGECDWLLKYHDARKQARAGEIDSLKKAKAVLSGSDYSFLQTIQRHGFLSK